MTAEIDGLFCGQELREQVHVPLLEIHRRMDITVESDIYACVSQNFAQALDVESQFNTSGRKGVSK